MTEALYNFALKKTSIEALVSIANTHKSLDFHESHNKSSNEIFTDEDDDEDDDDDQKAKEKDKLPKKYQGFDPKLKKINELEIKKIKNQKLVSHWCELRGIDLNTIDSQNKVDFNVEESELLNYRIKFLHYQNLLRLNFNLIAGDDSKFDAKIFKSIRDLSVLELSEKIARQEISFLPSNPSTETMTNNLMEVFNSFKFELRPFYLEIISEISEVIDPELYSEILPKYDLGFLQTNDCDEKIYELDNDWVYSEPFHSGRYRPIGSASEIFCPSSSESNFKRWYESRALNIADFSGRSDLALKLLKLALQTKNIDISQNLIQKMECFNQLVYNSNSDFITLDNFEKLPAREILSALTKQLSVEDKRYSDEFEKSINLVSGMLQTIDRNKLVLDYFRYHIFENKQDSANASNLEFLQKFNQFLTDQTTNESKDFQFFEDFLVNEIFYSDSKYTGAGSSFVDWKTYDQFLRILERRSGNKNCHIARITRHLEFYKLLQRFNLPLNFTQLAEDTRSNESIVKRIMNGCLSELNRKSTLLNSMVVNETEQNIALLHELAEKLTSEILQIPIELMLKYLLFNENLNQEVLKIFMAERNLLDDSHVQDLVYNSGLKFFDESDNPVDSTMALAKSRFDSLIKSSHPLGEDLTKFITSLRRLNSVFFHNNWEILQKKYPFMRNIRLQKSEFYEFSLQQMESCYKPKDLLDHLGNVIDSVGSNTENLIGVNSVKLASTLTSKTLQLTGLNTMTSKLVETIEKSPISIDFSAKTGDSVPETDLVYNQKLFIETEFEFNCLYEIGVNLGLEGKKVRLLLVNRINHLKNQKLLSEKLEPLIKSANAKKVLEGKSKNKSSSPTTYILTDEEIISVANLAAKIDDVDCAKFSIENSDEDTILEAIQSYEDKKAKNHVHDYLEISQSVKEVSKDSFWQSIFGNFYLFSNDLNDNGDNDNPENLNNQSTSIIDPDLDQDQKVYSLAVQLVKIIKDENIIEFSPLEAITYCLGILKNESLINNLDDEDLIDKIEDFQCLVEIWNKRYSEMDEEMDLAIQAVETRDQDSSRNSENHEDEGENVEEINDNAKDQNNSNNWDNNNWSDDETKSSNDDDDQKEIDEEQIISEVEQTNNKISNDWDNQNWSEAESDSTSQENQEKVVNEEDPKERSFKENDDKVDDNWNNDWGNTCSEDESEEEEDEGEEKIVEDSKTTDEVISEFKSNNTQETNVEKELDDPIHKTEAENSAPKSKSDDWNNDDWGSDDQSEEKSSSDSEADWNNDNW